MFDWCIAILYNVCCVKILHHQNTASVSIRTPPVLASCIQSNIREWSTVKSLSQTHGQCLAFFLLYRKCTHSQILVGLVTMREPSVHVHYIKHEFKAWSKRKRFNSVHSFMRFWQQGKEYNLGDDGALLPNTHQMAQLTPSMIQTKDQPNTASAAGRVVELQKYNSGCYN